MRYVSIPVIVFGLFLIVWFLRFAFRDDMACKTKQLTEQKKKQLEKIQKLFEERADLQWILYEVFGNQVLYTEVNEPLSSIDEATISIHAGYLCAMFIRKLTEHHGFRVETYAVYSDQKPSKVFLKIIRKPPS